MILRTIRALWITIRSRTHTRGATPPAKAAMTPGQIWTYCAVTLVLTAFGLAWLMKVAAVAPGTMTRSRTPQFEGQFAAIPMGGLYGTVTVRQLVNYYLQNPPKAPKGAGARPLPRIGGC